MRRSSPLFVRTRLLDEGVVAFLHTPFNLRRMLGRIRAGTQASMKSRPCRSSAVQPSTVHA